MKKSLIAGMTLAMLLSGSLAMAADRDTLEAGTVSIDGSASYQFRNDSGVASAQKKGSKTTILVNAAAQLNDQWSLYTRFAMQGASVGPDFKQNSAYSSDTQYVAGIDEFGFKYANGDTAVNIGRQPLFIGSTGLLYDTTGDLGKKFFVDGVNFSSKQGDFTYQLMAGQEDEAYGQNEASKNKIYAAHVDYAATQNFTLGATLGKYKYGSSNIVDNQSKEVGFDGYNGALPSSDSFNFSAVNASYTLGQATLAAEYAKTGLATDNHAYTYGVNYQFDDNNNASVYYYKTEQFGDINGNTTYTPNHKGFVYTYNHNFSKNINGSFVYKDGKQLGTNSKDNSLQATVTYNF